MFICTFDPFGEGRGRYTFRECCEEKPELKLKDGTRKIFYNSCYEGNNLPEELKKFYDYIEKDRVDSELTCKIEDAVDKGRQNAFGNFVYRRSIEAAQSRGGLPRSLIGGS